MISKKKMISLLMVACLLAGVPQISAIAGEVENTQNIEEANIKKLVGIVDVVATSTEDAYDENDVAVINQIITNNGLAEQGYAVDEPRNWDFVTWDGEEPKRVVELRFGDMGLSGKLDVSGLSNLTDLKCGWNGISGLDVSGLSSLTYLDCHYNSLSELDVNGLDSLTYLDCGWNSISELDVSGLNSLESLDCSSNSLSSLDVSGLYSLTNLDCGSNSISELDVSGLSSLRSLNCGWNSISELGVSGLSSLKSLNCSNNSLSSLNVSELSNLTDLNCEGNNLSSLDASGLSSLTNLYCRSNSLNSLDVSGLSGLEILFCSSNYLSNLDVSELSNLGLFDCASNNLGSLDISGLGNLTELYCYDNNLGSLDVSGLSSLERLICSSNNLSNLDVSELSNLGLFDCANNNLGSLDVSELSNLGLFDCANNNLGSLDVSGLSSLWDLNCSNNYLSSLDTSGLSNLGRLSCAGNDLSSLNLSGLGSLGSLDCSRNNLSSLDLGGLSNIEWLFCSRNNLSSLDVSGLSNLERLECGSNNLSSLDVSGLNNLLSFYCDNNPVRLLKLSGKGTLNINTSTGGSVVSLSGNCIETIGLGVEVLEGYQFQEWKTNGIILGDLTSATIEFEMPNNDVTITPKFTKNGSGNEDTEEMESPYTIIYELNGGRPNSSNPSSYTGESAITLYNPTREGYTFGGWYKESGFSTKVTSIAKGTTGKLILYANWNPISYTVTYQLNNGKNNSSNPSTFTIESAITLKNPTRTGYTFGGWYEEGSFKTKVSTISRTARNITLHAKWTADKYTVAFDKNKGTNLRTSSKTVTYASTYGTLPTVVRKGYALKGWYTKASGGSKVTSNTKVSITKKQTLYAQWAEVKKPGKATVSSVRNNKPKQMAVSLRRVSGASGYEIEYSTNSKFTSPSRVRITSLSRTIKSLRKGRTYFVRARAYRLDSAKNRVYGNYSAVRQVKISK